MTGPALQTARGSARSRLARLATAALGGALCAFALLAAPGRAQDVSADPLTLELARFTSTRWSMISPDKDYEGGCVVGFLAFEFSPTGYFTYNNRIRGSWRIDELGNLKLVTRDGQRVTLLVEGTTLRPSRNFAFLKRAELYQKCPA
jgi:hypothetical protein